MRSLARAVATCVNLAALLSAAALPFYFTVAYPSAHEGHGGVVPMVRQVRLGDHIWRISVGVVPSDPVAGEQLTVETQALEVSKEVGAIPHAARLEQIKLSIGEDIVKLAPTNAPSVFRGVYQTVSSGAHPIRIDVDAGGSAPTRQEFPLQLRTGPRERLHSIVVLAVTACAIGAIVLAWKNKREPLRRLAATTGGLLATGAVLLAADPLVTPHVAPRLLPERQAAAVDWVLDEPSLFSGDAGIDRATGGRPAQSGAAESVAVMARIVPAPDRTASVIVQIPGRIVPLEGVHVRVGQRVTAGQKLVSLQPTYIMHDALHLVNQRWPILVNATDARRKVLETDAALQRMKILSATGAVSAQEVQLAEAAATTATQQSERWSKALAMHDGQIKDDQPARMDIITPISGEIAQATFTQGQLVHEGDLLFTIIDTSTVWAEAKVPERMSADFRNRKTIEFQSASFGSSVFKGTLQRVAAQVDSETRTLSHFYAIDNSQRYLRVGMFVSTGGSVPAGDTPTGTDPNVLGHVEADPERVAQVVAPIWGRVEFADKPISVGEPVKKGQPLIKLILELSADERYQMEARDVEMKAAATAAATRKLQADIEYKRAIGLMRGDPQNKLRQQQVQAYEALFRAATAEQAMYEAQVRVFKTVMEKRDPRVTPVVAPIDGVLTELNVKPGELNPTGEFRKVFTVVDLSRVWIEADVFERNLRDLLKGPRASYTVFDKDRPRLLAPPIAILPSIDEKTRTLKVIFAAENTDGALRLGMTTHVHIEPASPPDTR